MIEIKENVNNVQEYNYLFDEVGWGHYDFEISKKALKKHYILYQFIKIER